MYVYNKIIKKKLSHVVSITSPTWDLNFINAFEIVILLSYMNIDTIEVVVRI